MTLSFSTLRAEPSPYVSTQFVKTGLVTGTTVIALDGEIPVEFLNPGDRIITRDSGTAPLVRLEMATVRTGAILFRANSLGHTRPESDTIVPAEQKLLIRDYRARPAFGAASGLMRAADLVDGEFIRNLGEQSLTLFRLVFEHPHIIYAGGLELSTN